MWKTVFIVTIVETFLTRDDDDKEAAKDQVEPVHSSSVFSSQRVQKLKQRLENVNYRRNCSSRTLNG